jgi:hypothetical protein
MKIYGNPFIHGVLKKLFLLNTEFEGRLFCMITILRHIYYMYEKAERYHFC